MRIKISKYHGCGNDFIIMDECDEIDYSKLAVKLCNRYTGVGADGFILCKKDPLEMIFYNADGTRAPMCGNGIRCFSRYLFDKGYQNKHVFDVITLAGVMKVFVKSLNPFLVQINMGKPLFGKKHIKSIENIDYYALTIHQQEYILHGVFMGTIHTVVFVDDIDQILKSDVGRIICNHSLFLEKTNVNFVQVIDEEHFIVRTYERGVGWTNACGTGACAAFVIGQKLNKCHKKVTVLLPYGELQISGEDDIFMQGPATFVFETDMEVEIDD